MSPPTAPAYGRARATLPKLQPVTEALAQLPEPSAPADAYRTLRARLLDSGTKLAVIDDDPTGTQVIADVPIVTAWDDADLTWALDQPSSVFFVLTNSRSMQEPRAVRINREIGQRLGRLASARGLSLRCVSRSDSTLRGHFPAECDALIDGLEASGLRVDGTILCPAFFSAGRYTIDDVHYVLDGDALVPVAETEFASDRTFGYTESNLVEWAVERGVERSHIRSLELGELRRRGTAYVVERLRALGGGVMIANAADPDDLLVLSLGLDQLERDGMNFVYRSGPSFPAIRAGIEPRSPLTPDQIETGTGHGLVVVGSHTRLTTLQLERARSEHELEIVELDARRLREGADEVRRCIDALGAALADGDAALITSREVVGGESAADSLQIAGQVADALVEVVASLRERPLAWTIAKGGITSSDIAVRAFRATRAQVVGQLFPNLVSLWRLDDDSLRPGMPYVVFPGNVGDQSSLSAVLRTLKAACR